MTDFSQRYARHLVLPDFGAQAQARLARSSILIVGTGGLGGPAALFLAAAGVGELQLSDFDTVDPTNLQRQILFTEADVGQSKTQAAAARLSALNTDVRIVELPERLQDDALHEAVAAVDLVLDASDNFGTRFAVNQACVGARTPLVSGAAIRYTGQIAIFDTARGGGCYACLYEETAEGLEDCQSNGVLGPVVGVIGSVMAVEAIQVLAHPDRPRHDRLQVYNAHSGHWRESRFRRDPACPVCAAKHRSKA